MLRSVTSTLVERLGLAAFRVRIPRSDDDCEKASKGAAHARSTGAFLCFSTCVFTVLLVYLLPTIFIGFNPATSTALEPANRTVLDLLQGETPSAPTSIALWFAEQRALRLGLTVSLVLVMCALQTTDTWKGRREGVFLCVLAFSLVVLVLSLAGLLSIIAVT